MRVRLALVATLAACGRIAIDPTGDAGDGMVHDGVSNGELCNGRDDNGNAVIDELACGTDCVGIDRAGRGYMLCDTSVRGLSRATAACRPG